jgi:hypothetical protein
VTNLLNLIKSSLEDVYCSTTLSSHGLLDSIDSSCEMNVIINLHLIFLISMETSVVMDE